MMSKEEILHYLAGHKHEFLDKYGITKIGLFGSYARGEATEESDIDILIEMKKDITDVHDKKEAFKYLIQNRFHKNVDIAREKYLKPLAKEEIAKDICYV